MSRLAYSIPVALFLVVAAYFAAALFSGRDPHQLPSALIDQPAPAFDLAGFDNAPGLARDQLAGQVVLVNFFASWCIPCRAEHPMLMRLSQQERVPLYGIAYKNKPDEAAQFLDQLGNPFRRVGLDVSGRVGIDFGVTGVPETFVIDRSGHIRRHYAVPLTAEMIRDDLLPLLQALNRT